MTREFVYSDISRCLRYIRAISVISDAPEPIFLCSSTEKPGFTSTVSEKATPATDSWSSIMYRVFFKRREIDWLPSLFQCALRGKAITNLSCDGRRTILDGTKRPQKCATIVAAVIIFARRNPFGVIGADAGAPQQPLSSWPRAH